MSVSIATDVTMLYEFVERHRDEIIKRYKARDDRSRSVPSPDHARIDHGVPVFLHQLVSTLRSGADLSTIEIARTAALHGHDLLLQGFGLSQVVSQYRDVGKSITDLALQLNAAITTEDSGNLERCIDAAIAGAANQFGRGRRPS